MKRRHLICVVLAATVLSACGGGAQSKADAEDDVGDAIKSYVKALNDGDVDQLIEVGGVPDDARARREAGRILAAKGGQGLSITNIDIDFSFWPEAGSADLAVEDKAGKSTRESFSVVKDGGWHPVIFADRPAPDGKQDSSTVRPG